MKHMKSILISIVLILTTNSIKAQCTYLDTLGIQMLQDSLSTFYPSICKKQIIGTSVLGRQIVALKISDNVNNTEAEPKILLQGCIHGDEDYPEQTMARLARELCLGYATNSTIQNIVNNREVWIIMLVNQDGFIGHSFGSRPNANGVDLNRDFGYMWNYDGFSTAPFGEPETKALRNFILEQNFSLIIDFHAGLQGIIYPWYYREIPCPDNAEFVYLVNQYVDLSGYSTGTFAVTSGFGLYPTNGSLCEFAYGSVGSIALSVELCVFGGLGIENPCVAINYNRIPIFTMIDKIGKGVKGIVKDAATNSPIANAKIAVNGKLPVYTNSVNGDYYKYLLPGTYTLTISANGYISQTFSITVTASGATTQDVNLTAGNVFAANKILTCRNLNNYSDPAETWNSLGQNDGLYYAIGDTGYAVLDMGAIIQNIAGYDFTIYGTSSGSGNAVEILCSNNIDGPWSSLGTCTSTSSFDLGANASIRYIKIIDNGVGAGNVAGSGFHLDAITAVNLFSGINEISNVDCDIILYPNPCSDVLHIKSLYTFDTINIYNSSGILQKSLKYNSSISIHELASGNYFVQLINKSVNQTIKIIKK